VAPLLVLVVFNVVVLVGQLLCVHGQFDTCREMQLFDPTGRFNRNARFVLLVGMVQWLQAWTGLFPSWYDALTRQQGALQRITSSVVIFLLIPASLLRFGVWLVKPAGIGVEHYFAGLPHHLVDSVLVIGWNTWLLVAAFTVASQAAVRHSGFNPSMIREDRTWRHLCMLFKYTLFLWGGLHFVRGCIALGPGHAQNDLVVISILYPNLVCIIWAVTFTAVALTRYAMNRGRALGRTVLLFAVLPAALLAAAAGLCWAVGRGGRGLLLLCVWLHFCAQAFRVVRRWSRWSYVVTPGKTLRFALDPKQDMDLQQTYAAERKLGRVAIRVLLLVCGSFCAVLAACFLMAGLQQRAGFFLPDVVWWRPLAEGVEISNLGASVLRLSRLNATSASGLTGKPEGAVPVMRKGEAPRYAVCGHAWHGLQLVDYAMMSSLSYMDPREENDLPGLLGALFPHKRVTIRSTSNNSERRWLEFDVDTCGPAATGSSGRDNCNLVTVIAVSGTDPTRIMDYAEDLRMWTEPCTLQILSFVFPTVRLWPRDTTAMVIGGIHVILKSLDMQDDRWHYQEILEHVRQIPEDREVVITGHSLGGGIALVVGSLTGHLAVAIQPPGVYHSLAKHHTQQATMHSSHAVHTRSVSLVVEGDWVQNFDGHGGLVQTMSCDQTQKSVVIGCHLLEGAICHLLRHCGDQAQRFAACQHDYKPISTALSVVGSAMEFFRGSWQMSYLASHWDSAAMASLFVSAIAVARYGAPALPRPIFQ